MNLGNTPIEEFIDERGKMARDIDMLAVTNQQLEEQMTSQTQLL